jgi:4-amino-4-deoxy-L-arabinose transferase-like glycosyltransferase
MMTPREQRFRRQWLYAALAVVALRLPHADGPSHDLTYQFAAAHNLVAGNGLTLYEHWGTDLTDPATLVTLSQFAAGYSLTAAALSSLGLGVNEVMKLLGAAATLIGWWGWGWLALPFFREALGRARLWRLAAFIVATVTPLLFTPPWGGTDIFLWTAVPWVLVSVVRGADETARHARRFDYLAGVLCGLAMLMRYGSVFLIPYTAALMLWQSRRRPQVLRRRWVSFALGVLPLLSIQLGISYVFSNASATPGGLNLNPSALSPWRLLEAISSLHMSNHTWAFWLPGQVRAILFSNSPAAWPWQLGLTAAGVLLLLLAAKAYRAEGQPAAQDARALSLGLFVAVPATLYAVMVFGSYSSYNYVGDQRYYGPLVPLSVFVAFSLAATGTVAMWRPVAGLVKSSATLYAVGYTTMILVYLALSLTPSRLGDTQRTRIMAAEVSRWPSMAVAQELSPARQAVLRRLAEDPQALLLTSRQALFEWDPQVDRSKLRLMACDRPAERISGPATVFVLTFNLGAPNELWAYKFDGVIGGPVRAACFERLPNLELVEEFPEEGLKLLQARVDPGRQVKLERKQPS